MNNICASKIANWYRQQKLISVLKKYKNFDYYNNLCLLDYFDFKTGLWDHRGLLSDINITNEREYNSDIDYLSDDNDDYFENEYSNVYSSEDDFSKDTFVEIQKEEQSLYQYIMSFFY